MQWGHFSRLNRKITKALVYTKPIELRGVRDTFISKTVSLSTLSRSHSKQKGMPDFLVCSSHQITTSLPWTFLNEGPDVRHMQICSRGGWETCWSEWLAREIHIHGNTSLLAWWFSKWLIRLQQLARGETWQQGWSHIVERFSQFLGIASVFRFLRVPRALQEKKKITCWHLRCKRSTFEGC